ncbi:MAG: LuxR C-terminal-related transcriptional regulator [Pseudomonadota bacterium]
MLSAFSHLLLTVYRRAQELDVQSFQDQILTDLKVALQFDSSVWGTATMTPAGIEIHSIHLYNQSPRMLPAYERIKHLDTAAMRVTQQPRATMGFNPERDFEGPAHEALRHFCEEFGHRNFFVTSDLNPRTRFVHWISLIRSNADQFCTPAEIELLSHLAPHLMQALALNRLVHLDRLGGSDASRETWAVAIADTRGVIYHADPRFRELMHLEWNGHSEERLPESLSALLAGQDSRVVGQRVVVERALEHEVLFLRARRRHAVDSLSTRELMVARLLADGLTQKQVAAQLDRSLETIRTQARTVFDKLDIKTVVMLAPQLALRD